MYYWENFWILYNNMAMKFFCCFFGGTGVWTQGVVLARGHEVLKESLPKLGFLCYKEHSYGLGLISRGFNILENLDNFLNCFLMDPKIFLFLNHYHFLYSTLFSFLMVPGLMIARQAFYHLSHSISSFLWYFWGRVSQIICLGVASNQGSLISSFWVARITGMSHWCPTLFLVLFLRLVSPYCLKLASCHLSLPEMLHFFFCHHIILKIV
jgi:hypothetical protein